MLIIFAPIMLTVNSILQINTWQFIRKLALYDSFISTTHISVLRTGSYNYTRLYCSLNVRKAPCTQLITWLYLIVIYASIMLAHLLCPKQCQHIVPVPSIEFHKNGLIYNRITNYVESACETETRKINTQKKIYPVSYYEISGDIPHISFDYYHFIFPRHSRYEGKISHSKLTTPSSHHT